MTVLAESNAICKGRVSNADPTFVDEVADRERQLLADHSGTFTNLVCIRAACAIASLAGGTRGLSLPGVCMPWSISLSSLPSEREGRCATVKTANWTSLSLSVSGNYATGATSFLCPIIFAMAMPWTLRRMLIHLEMSHKDLYVVGGTLMANERHTNETYSMLLQMKASRERTPAMMHTPRNFGDRPAPDNGTCAEYAHRIEVSRARFW
jgi:hypothetical protein